MTNSETPNQTTSKTLDTCISEVTVYSDRARVTRRCAVELNGAERQLIITGLPVILEPESVRVTGEGTVAVRLLAVRTDRIYATEPVAEKVAQLTQQIQEIEEQKRTIKDVLSSLQLQHKFIQELSEKSVDRFSRGLAQQQVGLNETSELLNFLGQHYSNYATTIAQREKEQHQLEKQIQVLRQQLQQVQTPLPQESFSIIVAIEPSGAGNFELELSYLVTDARWTPLYDLRVNTTAERLNLSYLAEVKQNTGEDWFGVSLTLSTAKPGLGTLPPKLNPWYIDVQNPSYNAPQFLVTGVRRRRKVTAENQLRAYEVDTFGDDDYEGALLDESQKRAEESISPPRVQAETVTAVTSTSGGTVTFEIGGNSDIPSDGTPHKITIFNDNYPCRKEYVAMPSLVSFSYLQANVTNPATGATLLPGKANIFRDNTFVGTTQLENVSPGQDFTINLGIDEGLKIERELVERKVDKKIIFDRRRTTYAYRLKIANLQEQETTLKLTEQLPVSRNEQLKVHLTQTNPKIQQGEMGLLEWSLTLPPQSKQEIYYQFTVEHSPSLTVAGLDV
ncbi:mucoidy inhibitor MuiA family protein [Argonema galeatum]|uniref:mucoidy inhibitor MuiA family protein n=1 Tax=Argonema galeatum TaxID=2942762 RepID=UPI002010E761|nr:mucoidy inhibitor MuiA family protein [Argonema galeatum A003/A1]